MARSYGLTANHVRAFEVVTADGQRRRVDREHEPDLFWALRGGGGSFAIVTAIELELLPTTGAYAGLLWYPAERAGEVLRAWRDLTDAAPPELSTTARILNVPDLPDTPIPLRGRSFAVVDVYHLGPISGQARRLLEPLRALAPTEDSLRATSTSDLLHIHLDPEQPTPGVGDGWLLSELRDDTIDAIVDAAADCSDGRLAVIELRHLEGALARSKPGDGALPGLAGRYVALAGGLAPTPELTKRVGDSARARRASAAAGDRGPGLSQLRRHATQPRELLDAGGIPAAPQSQSRLRPERLSSAPTTPSRCHDRTATRCLDGQADLGSADADRASRLESAITEPPGGHRQHAQRLRPEADTPRSTPTPPKRSLEGAHRRRRPAAARVRDPQRVAERVGVVIARSRCRPSCVEVYDGRDRSLERSAQSDRDESTSPTRSAD